MAVLNNVHCHVGSLEMNMHYDFSETKVHCHVGSLEKSNTLDDQYF